ncbi:multidrug effflux MFS transporter [Georgenia halophila]|uniref:Multidrug effflux MFS transporter n=1 Tax=Georgenia halophila TaxID=620889 RepID=A0ABP8KVB4_9MICO
MTAVSFPAKVRPPVSLVLLLGSMAALPAITTDLYLPSLPAVADDLDSSQTLVQATITGVLVGGAIGQLLTGPLSDRFGRRLPVMVGFGLHVVVSVLCALTPGIWPLVVLRVLQGVGNATATVTAMAVIRDRYTGSGASVLMSRLMLVIGVAPLFAPTAGGLIAGWWGWRATFVVLAVLGAVMIAVVALALPETLPPERRRREGLGGAARSYRALLGDRQFMALAVLPGLALGAIISYVAGSPFVFQEQYGLTETQFALIFALNGAGLVGGAQINAALMGRFTPLGVIRVVAPTSAVLGIWLLSVAMSAGDGTGGLIALLVPLFLLISVNSLLMPNASALALSKHGERAGAAAALVGSLQAGIAGTVSPLVGALGGNGAAMATVMLGTVLTALVIVAVATPAYRRT